MRVGMGQIHRQPPQPMAAMMRRRGIGQTGATPINLQLALNSWFQSLKAQPQSDAAVGCGGATGGAPCASPEDAAQMVYGYAASICNEASAASTLAGTLDPNCNDGGQAVAAALYPQVLALFQSFPASVWATEAANAASGQYYGAQPAGACPTGMFENVGPQGIYCSGSTANQDLQNVPLSIVANAPASAPAVLPAAVAASAPAAVPASSITTSALIPATAAGVSSSSTSDPWGFLTEASIDGIPNWMLILGGAALVFLVPSLMGGRR